MGSGAPKWPRSARITAFVLAVLAIAGWLLFAAGVRPDGTYSPDLAGSIAEWAAVFVTIGAVGVAWYALRTESARWLSDRNLDRQASANQVTCESALRASVLPAPPHDNHHIDRVRITQHNSSAYPIRATRVRFTWPPGHTPLNQEQLATAQNTEALHLGGANHHLEHAECDDTATINRWVQPGDSISIEVSRAAVGDCTTADAFHDCEVWWTDSWRDPWRTRPGGPSERIAADSGIRDLAP